MCVQAAVSCHVEVVHDPARLRSRVPAWGALAAAAVEPNVFYESWMLLPALDAFGSGEDIAVALVWVSDPARPSVPATLGALLPLQRLKRFRHSPLPAWRLWKYRHCYLCTPLVRAGVEDAVLDAFLSWLRNAEGPQMLDLGNIAGEGPFRDALERAAERHRLPAMVSDHHERALLHVGPENAESLHSPGSAQFRKSLRRSERRLGEMGLARHDSVADATRLERWTDEFLAIERSGWKGKAGSALACSGAGERYFRDVVHAAHGRGRLMVAGLDAAGKPIARRCTFLAGEGAFAFKTAYDEAFAHCAPGVVLERDAIRHALAQPQLRWVDSCTAPDNQMLNRLWNGRRVVESVALGAGTLEKLLIATVPMLRRVRRLLPEQRP
jgi:CelD/BcsL family acetyltransferase involved in cellulose biosynthesis